jgi:gluconolactonase
MREIQKRRGDMKLTKRLFLFFLIVGLAACGVEPAATTTASGDHPSPEPVSITPLTEAPIVGASPEALIFDPSLDLELSSVAGSYFFTEGPATDANGNVYFSDINAGNIFKWSTDGSVTVFVEGLNTPNGLMFGEDGNLVACESGNGRLINIDSQGGITVLADQYNGIRFNEPNDLWIDALGGIYFTDPAYQYAVVQDGEHVYYLWPDRSKITRVISDMVRPNGLVGTADGTTLYVADHGAGQTFAYTINSDGTLFNKRLFVSTGSDGMTVDTAGNLYLTTPNQVQVYDAAGNQIAVIPTQENPTNVTFAGTDGLTLFITARTAVYTVRMSAQAASMTETSTPEPSSTDNSGSTTSTSGFTLTSPDLPSDGRLPVEYTCDGVSSTLALEWSGAPEGTVSYAVIMQHVASPEDIHWYMVLYNLPADVTSLSKNYTGIGTLGNNSVNGRTEYSPPCSKGPGDKTYTFTVYALSAQSQLSVPASEVDRATLLAAIQDITLASAELNVVYARQ